MNAAERLGSYIFRGVYTVSGSFHPFGGAVDIVVVEQPDGSFKSSPWYVRFGKFQGVLKTREKIVNIAVNGVEAGFHMYLDHKGEAYFLREVDGNDDGKVFSPVLSVDEMDEKSQNGQLTDSQSGNFFDENQSNMINRLDVSNGKIASRKNSRPSRIFGLLFGRKSMKDDSSPRKGEIDMQRIKSLERAEIAADLLEVRWSTNLSTSSGMTNASSVLSAPEAPGKEATKDTEVSDKQEISSPSVHDSMNCSALDVNCPCFQIHKRNLQTAHGAEDVHINELPTFEPSVIHLRGPSFESEASSVGDLSDFKCSSTGEESNRVDSLLTEDIPGEESQQNRVSTSIHRETSVSFGSGINGSSERGLEKLSFGNNGQEVEVYTDVLHDATELVSDMNSGPESDVYTVKERSFEFDDPNLGLSRMENSRASEKPIEESISFESSSVDTGQNQPRNLCSIDTQLLCLDSVESKMQEINSENATSKRFPPVKTLTMGLTEFSLDQSQLTERLSSQITSNGAGNEKATSTSDFHVGSLKVDQIPGSISKDKTEGICSSSSLGRLRNQEQETEILGDKIDTHKPLTSSPTFAGTREPNDNFLPQDVINSNLSPSDILEEDHFLFSDNDDFAESAIRHGDFTSGDVIQTDGPETEAGAEEHEPHDVSHLSLSPLSQSLELCCTPTSGSHSGGLTTQALPNTSGNLPKESLIQASPLCIPRSHRSERGGQCSVGSLPNIQNHINDLDSDVCKCQSCLLDLSTESLECCMLRKDLPCPSKSKLVAESDLAQDLPTTSAGAADVFDMHKMREHEETSSNTAVEVPLCRHLLFEGMGADAASQAFDSNKLAFKNFGDLGPSIVKNDKLVVRTGGRYFPWNVAAPVVPEMVSLGQEPIFQPEGMIAVDPLEKTLQGKFSGATAPSGGSWRIWPFSLRKSRSELSVHPAPYGTKGNVAGADENASENRREVSEYKMNKGNTPKKKAVPSLVPTLEEIESLNLKEGQNMITFTFSTAMLGRQQVHARIYVWKWNTRIVVSDVDGTITKSDVLGQFMPLVGRDWSQSGVTHLFSAIKENGYQFLFLSARSIYQADLTRQFLFNLKQNGKTLPDGPVLISPDGLFPSLYREVIRRAPHEFKIACLEDIRSLFLPECNPFYAGYGNRDTDEISYLKVGIPKGKIFIINPKGEVAVNRNVDTRSYTSLHALVNGMFPPTSSSSEQEEYNSWNYWRTPLPQIDV